MCKIDKNIRFSKKKGLSLQGEEYVCEKLKLNRTKKGIYIFLIEFVFLPFQTFAREWKRQGKWM